MLSFGSRLELAQKKGFRVIPDRARNGYVLLEKGGVELQFNLKKKATYVVNCPEKVKKKFLLKAHSNGGNALYIPNDSESFEEILS